MDNKQQTREAFEYQWEKWGLEDKIYGMDEQEYKTHVFNNTPGFDILDEFFKGKTILEAGCGHGMVGSILSPLCKEYTGIDIGKGIERARARLSGLKNVKLVQCDILDMPPTIKKYDFVFCTGVIHHTGNTRKAFRELSKKVKSGGHLYIWVYPKGNIFWEYSNKLLRAITTRLRPRTQHKLSRLLIPLLLIFRPYANNRIGKNTIKELSQSVFDWISPKFQSHHTEEELLDWYSEERYYNVRPFRAKTGAIGRKV